MEEENKNKDRIGNRLIFIICMALSALCALFICLSFLTAQTVYSGETITINLDEPYEYYSVVGNSSEVVLKITQENNIATIEFNKYMKEDSFEIIFLNKEKETITVYQSSGGGGGSTTTKYVNKEVPTYLDRLVVEYEEKIVVKEVPIEQEREQEKVTIKDYIFIGIIVALLLALLYALFVDRSEKNSDRIERRYSDE